MIELEGRDFAKTIESDIPVVVDFWAPWCMPCKIFTPVMEEVADEMDGQAIFCKLNIDDNQDIAVNHSIASIPTVVIFKNGEAVDRFVGLTPKEEVIAMVQKHL